MMTKWDTIQADVADMYIGVEEKLQWEEAMSDSDYFVDDEELTLDWED